MTESARLWQHRSGQEDLPYIRVHRRWARGATPCLRSWAVAQRSYSTFKLRRGSHEEILLVQGKEQRLCFAGAAVKRYPTSKVRETQVVQLVVQEGIKGQTHWNHNHRKLANLITPTQWNLAIPCGATQDRRVMVERSDRMWSTGEGNGKPLQYSCLENPMNSMKRQNDGILKEELPRSVGAKYATGDQWRNNSRKNERMEPKQKQYPLTSF